MKRFISIVLILVTLFMLVACTQVSSNGEYAATLPKGYAKADDPLTPEKMAAIPIASASMTTEELRQICVDYLKLSVSCQWVSDGNYFLVEWDNDERRFKEGKLYGGIPYVNMASGNLYRFMEFYDSKTGVFDSKAMRKNPELFATACSGSVGWAWSRVINSAEISWTHSLNAQHGLVPIGPYTYDYEVEQFWEWGKKDKKIHHLKTLNICKENTTQVMYESYALAHLADCFNRSGHVAMAVSEPVVVRDADGKIDGENSYIMLAEQGQYTTAEHHLRVTSDGTEYRIRGNDGRAFSFATLFKKGFIVHTFKEFIGVDPVEPGEVIVPMNDGVVSVKEIGNGDLTANYPISDVFTTVCDRDGNTVYEYVMRTTDHFTRAIPMETCIPVRKLRKYRKDEHTVQIAVQLSNGELITAYEGMLTE